MKLRYLVSILGISALTSCTKLDLHPLSEASNETWYTNKAQIEMSLNTLFLHQFWPVVKTEIPTATAAFDELADDWTNRTTLLSFTNGTFNSQTAMVGGIWSYSYKAISRANTILANIDRAKANLSDQDYRKYIATARFVRACQYSRIITLFGDPVYFNEELELEEAFKMGRTAKAVALQKVYEDFDYAIQNLPVDFSGNEIQRVSKGAAYAMKARIALYMEDWETAKNAADECIKLQKYRLYPSYPELFLSKTKNSVESVFIIPRAVELSADFNAALRGGNITAYLPRTVGGTSTGNPSWDLFCSYLCTDGKPIDESPLYNPRKPFLNRDPRCTATIAEFDKPHLGFTYSPHPDSSKVWSYTSGIYIANKDSKAGDQYASYNGLVLKKGIDGDWTDDLQAAPDKILMRYADVLLMYAEAKIELNDIDASVLDAINQVRARAYGVNVSQTSSYPAVTVTAQAALRKQLRMERRMEMAFEGLRYFDIRRWKLAEKVMNRPNYGLLAANSDLRTKLVVPGLWFFPGTPDIDDDGTPNFATMNQSLIRKLSTRVFDKNKHYLWPIPASDILINPNLKQNPNY
ncbi:RagB/SusD family nutrient uptake outer membrane protein [Pedobacter nanyangensis]|uniref:RagB/SusD family nutrient uptake outer membrane protein n=1 Tax=Pedobacter nanyangensis TaxID=1562389 RepID=UPI000DE22232|nr:RagB/SusD family nutrient uptake outer membrane protein [Pedobacter nanyangensis]